MCTWRARYAIKLTIHYFIYEFLNITPLLFLLWTSLKRKNKKRLCCIMFTRITTAHLHDSPYLCCTFCFFYFDFVASCNISLFVFFGLIILRNKIETGGSKPATLDTGAVVNVPLFINIGDQILVDSRTGQYMNRA